MPDSVSPRNSIARAASPAPLESPEMGSSKYRKVMAGWAIRLPIARRTAPYRDSCVRSSRQGCWRDTVTEVRASTGLRTADRETLLDGTRLFLHRPLTRNSQNPASPQALPVES